jgi:hypothetical protein
VFGSFPQTFSFQIDAVGPRDEAGVLIVLDVGAGFGGDVDAGKIAGPLEVGGQAALDFLGHFIRVALELLGAVFGQLGDGGLGGVPNSTSYIFR